MHSLLESYLAEVTRQLGPLPVARRNEELREVRQHLLDAVMVNKERGQGEDEAAASAVEQCGDPEELAHSLVRAWRRGVKLNYRDFWGTVAGFWVMERGLLGLNLWLTLHTHTLLNAHSWLFGAGVLTLHVGVLPLTGVILGLAFPRRAGTGILLASGVNTAFRLINFLLFFHQHQGQRLLLPLNDGIFSQAIYFVAWGCIPALAAFLASRWRKARPWRGLERLSRSTG